MMKSDVIVHCAHNENDERNLNEIPWVAEVNGRNAACLMDIASSSKLSDRWDHHYGDAATITHC